MKDKASRINEPINDILHLTKQFESSLKNEIKGQKGLIIDKIKEEIDSKSEKRQSEIKTIKEENINKVSLYKSIIEDLRVQDVTLYYKKRSLKKAFRTASHSPIRIPGRRFFYLYWVE
ncbi:YvzA [Bacillus atrophaeus UCMB-5137]|nr:YvzA [Bacillus atrophaeus UCMB-5137]